MVSEQIAITPGASSPSVALAGSAEDDTITRILALFSDEPLIYQHVRRQHSHTKPSTLTIPLELPTMRTLLFRRHVTADTNAP